MIVGKFSETVTGARLRRHWGRAILLALPVICLIPSAGDPVRLGSEVSAQAQAAGSQPLAGANHGRFRVSMSGNGVFTLPVPVPPGIRGHHPKVTVHYSSAAQNGMLGVGFNLTGFSRVSRVKKIIAIDGEAGSITHTNQDRFALHGKRLLVMTGANGAAGSTYRTELESWHDVTSTGAAGQGPEQFHVRLPDGGTRIYGGTGDSRVLVGGTAQTVRQWLMSSHADRNGNLIEYSYSTDPLKTGKSSSFAYPAEIAWGHNPTVSPGSKPDRFIRFGYETRPDPITRYQAGSEITTTARLSTISTWLGKQLVAEWRLSYKPSAATGRSRLTGFQRFASAAAGATGLSPTNFAWSDGGNAFAGANQVLSGYFSAANNWDPQKNPVTLADVNGDGRVDIVGFKSGTQVALATASGYKAPVQWVNQFSVANNWTADQPRYMSDINGDGMADIVGFSKAGVVTALADPASNSFTLSPNVLPIFSPNNGWPATAPRFLADVNGDHRADIVGMDQGVTVALADGKGGFANPVSWSSKYGTVSTYKAADLLLADVNGDGKADVVAMNQNTQTVDVALSTGSAFSNTGWAQGYGSFASDANWGPDKPRMMSDVNGDGLADIVGFGTAVQVGISTGTGFLPPAQWSTDFGAPNWTSKTPRMLMDVNGDGRSDIVAVNDGGVQIATSNGAAFVPGNWNQGSMPGLGLAQGGTAADTARHVVDIDGDGLMDMLAVTPLGVSTGLTAGQYPDLMNGVTRSSLGQVAVTYKPLSDPSVYGEKTGQGVLAKLQAYRPLTQNASLPVYRGASRLTGQLHVVASVDRTNNPALTSRAFSYTSTHTYQDGESSDTGRGFLGFARGVHVNQSMGRTVTLDHSQAFPTIGRVTGRRVTCAGTLSPGPAGTATCATGDVFHASTHDYAQSTSATSTTTGYKAILVRVKALQSDKYQGQTWQHATATTYDHDIWGNVTRTTLSNLVDQTGKDLDPSDNVYIHQTWQNDAKAWQLGFPLMRLRTPRSAVKPGAGGALTFDATQDFSLHSRTYDTAMNLKSRGVWDQPNTAFLTTGYTHDGWGNRLTVARPGGQFTTYTWDDTWHTYPASRTTPKNQAGTALVTRYGYDARFGHQSLMVDANGNQSTTCYDDFGRRARRQVSAPGRADPAQLKPACLGATVTVPAGVTAASLADQVTYTHGWDNGVPITTTTRLARWPAKGATPVTHSTVTYFDGLHRAYRQLGASKNGGPLDQVLMDRTFNAAHQPLTELLPHDLTASNPSEIGRDWDALGRAAGSTSPWDAPGGLMNVQNQRTITQTASGETETQLAAVNTKYPAQRVITRSPHANRLRGDSYAVTDQRRPGLATLTTTAGRDLLGRLSTLVPPGGVAPKKGAAPGPTVATYTRDSVGRLASKTLPSLGTITYHFGTDGRLKSRDQANGTIGYTYDNLGRPLVTSWPGGLSVTRHWDNPAAGANGLGRLSSASVAGQAVPVNRTFTYNAAGQTVSSALTAGPAGTKAMTRMAEFDPQGRVTQQTLPDGSVLGTTWDAGRVISRTVAGKQVLGLGQYSAFGLAGQISYGNGVTATLKHAPDLHTSGVTWQGPAVSATPLLAESYDRDPFGLPLNVTGSGSVWSAYTIARTFANRRLSTLQDSRTGGTAPVSYGFDAAGNLLSGDGLGITADGFAIATGSTLNGKALGPTYGKMGELTGVSAPAAAFTATYDGRNRLASMKPGSTAKGGSAGASRFAYDHRGRRVWVQDGGGRTRTILSPQYETETTAPGGTPSPVVTLHSPLGPAWRRQGGADTYLHGDARHSITFTTDTGGKMQDRYRYSAWGVPVMAAGKPAPAFGFLGREYDGDTGLYYYAARYYHPVLGRFTRADTRYGAHPARHDAANRYAFLLNNPAIGFDPSGHGIPACLIGLGGGAFTLVAGASQMADGHNQHNDLSAYGVGLTTLAGGVFATSGGASACLKYYRKTRPLQPDQPADGDGAGPDGVADGGGDAVAEGAEVLQAAEDGGGAPAAAGAADAVPPVADAGPPPAADDPPAGDLAPDMADGVGEPGAGELELAPWNPETGPGLGAPEAAEPMALDGAASGGSELASAAGGADGAAGALVAADGGGLAASTTGVTVATSSAGAAAASGGEGVATASVAFADGSAATGAASVEAVAAGATAASSSSGLSGVAAFFASGWEAFLALL